MNYIQRFGAGLLLPALLAAFVAALNTKAISSMMAITSCSSSTACIGGSNSLAGPGVQGISKKGSGVDGTTSNGLAGVSGSTSSTNYNASGVLGRASQNAIAVQGLGTGNVGVQGSATNAAGVLGIGTVGAAMYALSYNSAPGIYATSNQDGYAVEAHSETGTSLYAVNGCGGCPNSNATAIIDGRNYNGEGVDAFSSGGLAGRFENQSSSQGDGVEIVGPYIGIIGRASSGTNAYPIALTDTSGNNLFFVNGNGDVFYHGSLNTFMKTRDGNLATAYGSKSTSSTVEDTGTAQLVNGAARISLNPAFAQAIDTHRVYQVFLTPGGDTRGLYVSMKSSTSFIVRETQGGRGTFSFDYRIDAPALGHANERMTEITPSTADSMLPKAKVPLSHALPAFHALTPRVKM